MKRKPLALVGSFILVIVVLSIVRVSILNSISTTGIELVNLQNDITKYKKENVLLKEEYLAVSSLTTIDKQAKSLGFVDTKAHIYLNTPLPLALRQ